MLQNNTTKIFCNIWLLLLTYPQDVYMGELFHSYPGTNYQIPPDLDSVVQNPPGAVLHLPQEADTKEKYFLLDLYKK